MADNIESRIDDITDGVRDMTREGVMASNAFKNLDNTLTNIHATMQETAKLANQQNKIQDRHRKNRAEAAEITKRIKKEQADFGGLKNSKKFLDLILNDDSKRLDILNEQATAMQKQHAGLENQISLHQEIDALKQKYLKNQTLISFTEWDGLLAAQQTMVISRAYMHIGEKLLAIFNEQDDATTKIRQTFGTLNHESGNLHGYIRKISIDMRGIGASSDDIKDGFIAIGQEASGLLAYNKDLLSTTVMMNKSFGVTYQTSVKFLKTLGGISGESMESQTGMAGFAKSMSRAAGVPLDTLMSDVANASDDIRIFVGKSATQMVKVAAQAKLLGSSLSDAASTAKSFLQFESSITNELRASALIGKSINFNEARRLSFNKDTIGVTKEILRLTKEVKFNELNPLQMEAFASASGKSVAELQSMLSAEQNMARMRSSTNEDVQNRLRQYDDLMKMSQNQSENEGERTKLESLRLSNQTRMNAMQSQYTKLVMELMEPMLEVVEPIMNLAANVLPSVARGLVSIAKLAAPIYTVFSATSAALSFMMPRLTQMVALWEYASGSVTSFSRVIASFAKYTSWIKHIITGISELTGWFGKVLKFSKFLVPIFGKFIPVLGQIYTVATGISAAFAAYGDKGFWGAVRIGIKAALLDPFIDAWNWLSGKFLGNSPSELGLRIVKGLTSVGPMLLNALKQPFIDGYNWIAGSKIGQLFGMDSSKQSITSSLKGAGSGSESGSKASPLDDIKSSNELIANKIDELISLMSSGGIAVTLDGTKVSQMLATSAYNRGSRGTASSIS
jgi:hypothetical protein